MPSCLLKSSVTTDDHTSQEKMLNIANNQREMQTNATARRHLPRVIVAPHQKGYPQSAPEEVWRERSPYTRWECRLYCHCAEQAGVSSEMKNKPPHAPANPPLSKHPGRNTIWRGGRHPSAPAAAACNSQAAAQDAPLTERRVEWRRGTHTMGALLSREGE